ncbi:Trk system potassium uptake protein TrkA [Pseudomonas sp. MM221]|nr:Trk system potassium uptake protein TrkA [Pseudomonas sp. MM221]
MKIIILGAGQVGGTLAEHLASEANDITVVDTDGERLRDLGDRLDIRTVQGRGSLPTVLRQAGADDADMLVAVTNSDETNMVACQVAYSLFHTPTKIARVRESSYLTREELFDNDHIPVDVLISPEQVVTNYIKRLIEHPGSLQVIDFAEGKAQLVAVKAYYGGPLVGQQLRQIRAHMPNVDTRVAAIFRRDRPITPRGDTVIEADDEVFFIAAKKDIRAVMGELRRIDETNKRIVIAGGGQIGERLAEAIESRYQVKIIEMNPARCRHLSDTLESTVVLQGSASDKDLMLEENIADADIFLALTNDDEANIMSSLLAKRLGAGKVMTIINNPAYVDLVQGGDIDIAISPQLATIGTLLAHVRRGDIVSVHSLRAARPRRSRPWRTGIRSRARWLARPSKTSPCHRAPPLARSSATKK